MKTKKTIQNFLKGAGLAILLFMGVSLIVFIILILKVLLIEYSSLGDQTAGIVTGFSVIIFISGAAHAWVHND